MYDKLVTFKHWFWPELKLWREVNSENYYWEQSGLNRVRFSKKYLIENNWRPTND